MKKKISISFFLILFSSSAFCQTASDYFPAQEGYRWEYIGPNGQVTDRYMCVTRTIVDENETFIGFYQESLEKGIKNTRGKLRSIEDFSLKSLRVWGNKSHTHAVFHGKLRGIKPKGLRPKTKVIYRVLEDTVITEVAKPDNNVELVERDRPIVVLFLHDRNWQEEDGGDIFQCQSRKTNVSFDGKTYDDCIVVEKAIILADGRPLMTKRQYFARGVGLVYVTLQDAGDSVERPILRLSSHNF
jgi:hypothetical protein